MDMKCPVCGCKLESDDAYDGNFYEESVYEEDIYGHCPFCGREYRWTNRYAYKETVDFEEVIF